MKKILHLTITILLTVLATHGLFAQYTLVEYKIQELKTLFFSTDSNGESTEQMLDLNNNEHRHLQKPPRYITLVVKGSRSYQSKKKITDYVKNVAAITDIDEPLNKNKNRKTKKKDVLDLNKQLNTSTDLFVFKDSENDLYFSKVDLFMKTILIYDKIPKMNWKIEKEKKKIGRFTCRKAITVHDDKQMTAWFTDEIPRSFGPNEFGGLPGLILKLEFEDQSVITVSRLIQNTDLAFQFPKPEKKSGTMSYAEFTEANNKIIGQLLEAFRSSKDGNIQININQ